MTSTRADDRISLFETFHLSSGSHEDFKDGACALELVSYVAGETWSDHPECVCPVLAAFFRAWNDGLADADRDETLRPFLPRLIGTNGGSALAERRALMAADWLVRVHTPAWLRLAKLNAQADALEALPEIVSMAQIPSVRGPIEAVRKDASAARAAAWDAAWEAARDAAEYAAWAAAGGAAWAAAREAAGAAAGAAAREAAWEAAWAAARDAAEYAAWAAARAAARAAAWAALRPTQDDLIKSAAYLVERMLSIGVES
jgi:hypothetical protein